MKIESGSLGADVQLTHISPKTRIHDCMDGDGAEQLRGRIPDRSAWIG